MTIKETLVSLLRAEGYDMFNACELASKCIREFKASGKTKETYHVGRTSVTIARKD